MRFGPFELSDSALMRDGVPLAVGRRGLAVLAALAKATEPVTREKLIEAGWPGLITRLAKKARTSTTRIGKAAERKKRLTRDSQGSSPPKRAQGCQPCSKKA